MDKKILLVDANYQVQSFIDIKKAIKHIFNGKVEIISNWHNEEIHWGNGKISYPSILKLNKAIKRNYYSSTFNRPAIVKRDDSKCQYCNKKLTSSHVTIDHVIPKAHGGLSTFHNCVVACHTCNNGKADRTPEQAGMKLIKRPVPPSFAFKVSLDESESWNHEWNDFIK